MFNYQKCQSIQVNDFGALNLVNDKNIVLGYHMNITNNKAIQEFNLPFVVSYEASKNVYNLLKQIMTFILQLTHNYYNEFKTLYYFKSLFF